ncbi:AhpC/TSA family protein [Mucilaginibacter sp. BJC16-A38]|uniref:TlpA disulfide reductase family protein n=1 Tax=Mucilaginibacter phenanthrenivorans TaxID=1234842 RepID=UPI00215803EB|nr:TlpA disulfide reductase family protein [Mucilaginibacter phenanthrenivorans]MCR8561906.1 AhpC/TSA family protein [Mucilaginibacter phenanthrenivorans]
MKTLLNLLSLFVLFPHILCAQNKKTGYVRLTGTVTGRTATVMYLSYSDENKKRHNYKSRVKNKAFYFELQLKSPVDAWLMRDGKPKSENESYASEIFLSPGTMTVDVEGNHFDRAKITGSAMQNDLDGLQELMKPTNKVKDSLYNELFKVEAAGNTPKNHTAHVKIASQIDKYNEHGKHIDYNFISTHPSSYLSAYLLDNYVAGRTLPLDSAYAFYNSFASAVKSSIAGLSVKNNLDQRKISAVGSMAPLFSKTDVAGRSLNLKSFIGKHYLILEFWGSYCVPQREETRHLKQLYNKYHSKGLEVIGISFDFSKKEWETAIANDSTAIWHHVRARNAGDDGLWGLYDIQGLPPSLFILIDNNGRIAGRYRGKANFDLKKHGEGNMADLDKKVHEIMGADDKK